MCALVFRQRHMAYCLCFHVCGAQAAWRIAASCCWRARAARCSKRLASRRVRSGCSRCGKCGASTSTARTCMPCASCGPTRSRLSHSLSPSRAARSTRRRRRTASTRLHHLRSTSIAAKSATAAGSPYAMPALLCSF